MNRKIKKEPKESDKKSHPAIKVESKEPKVVIKKEPDDKKIKPSADSLRKVKKDKDQFKKSKKVTSKKDLVKKMTDSSLPKVLLHRIKSPKSQRAKVKGNSASYEIAKWILTDEESSDDEDFRALVKGKKRRKKRFLIEDSDDEASGVDNDDDVQFVASFSQNDVCIEISDDEEYMINSQLASMEKIKEEPNEDCGRDDSSDNEQESMLEQIYSQQIEADPEEPKPKAKVETKMSTKNIFSDESDEEDTTTSKDISESSDESIPSLDSYDEDPLDDKEQKKKKTGKTSKRRLSDEEIRKALDSDEEDFENCKPITRKKPRTEDGKQRKKKDPDNDNLSTDDATPHKQAKLIDALPQPHRKAKLRGISENTLKRQGSKDEKPMCSKWLTSRKPTAKSSQNDFIEKPSSAMKKDIKTIRKEKLEQLALKGKQEKEGKVEEEPRPVPKAKANVKRSEPKLSNFLQLESLDCKPKPKRVSRVPSKDAPEASEPMQQVAKENVTENVTENVLAMEVEDGEIAERKAAKSTKKTKKSLKWVDSDGKSSLEQVRLIPKENQGRPITKENLSRPMNHQGNLLPVPMEAPPNVQAPIGPPIYRTEGMYEKILNWSTQWLKEQKKMSKAPPVFDDRPLQLKTNTFASYKGKTLKLQSC